MQSLASARGRCEHERTSFLVLSSTTVVHHNVLLLLSVKATCPCKGVAGKKREPSNDGCIAPTDYMSTPRQPQSEVDMKLVQPPPSVRCFGMSSSCLLTRPNQTHVIIAYPCSPLALTRRAFSFCLLGAEHPVRVQYGASGLKILLSNGTIPWPF